MGAQRSTLKQLAAELDISVATVSRALGGYEDISKKTRERVAQKAQEMGYVPNSAGRMLVSGRSGFVGLVVPIRGPNLVDSFLGEFVTGLGEGLKGHGSDLFLATALESQSELSVLSHVVESGRADGVVLNRVGEKDERVEYLLKRKFPFVTHGRLLNADYDLNWLDTDGGAAFAEMFDMLYDLGHRKFGLLTISDPMTFRHYREAGLRQAIEKKGDPEVALTEIKTERFDTEGMRRACRDSLTGTERPTAYIALFDEIALTLMKEAANLGLSIPDDLSVVGFDNVAASAYAPPGLTTYDQDIRGSAKQLTDMLMQVIVDQPDKPLTRLVKPKLIRRASHGPAPS